ncbi:hypothetical protein [Streptomyces sp. CT34]|nr:hypothetical protein [Streptomyces sp. CT34]
MVVVSGGYHVRHDADGRIVQDHHVTVRPLPGMGPAPELRRISLP